MYLKRQELNTILEIFWCAKLRNHFEIVDAATDRHVQLVSIDAPCK